MAIRRPLGAVYHGGCDAGVVVFGILARLTAVDNSVVTLDQAGMGGLFQALGAHVAATIATAKAAKDAINAATTVEQIEAALATPN